MLFLQIAATHLFSRKKHRRLIFASLALLCSTQVVAQTIPTITSLSANSGIPGSSLTIEGTNFNTTTSNNIVYVGHALATVTAATATSLTVTVPEGAQLGPVSVLNATGDRSVQSRQYFQPIFTPNRSDALRAADIADRTLNAVSAASDTVAMASGDLDADGKPDIVLGEFGSDKIHLFRNTSTAGNPGFAAPVTYTIGSGYGDTYALALGDIDGDGRLDIVGTSYSNDSFVVLRNSGTLSTFSATMVPTATRPFGLALADLDLDGRLDVAIGSFAAGGISVHRNANNGTAGHVLFETADVHPLAVNIQALAAADFDSDGKPDIVATTTGEELRTFRNTTAVPGATSFAQDAIVTWGTNTNPFGISPGDLDGDGDLDLVIALSDTGGTQDFTLLTNTSVSGTISFTGEDIAVGGPQRQIALGDINGDGKADLLVPSRIASPYRALVLTNTTTAADDITFAAALELDADTAIPTQALIVDLDGDTRSDLLVTHANSGRFSTFRNQLITTPQTQASDLETTTLGSTTATLAWTNGSAQRRMVFVKAGDTGTPAPVDRSTYTPDAAFGSGTQIGATGWYAVAAGTGSSVTITGLTPETAYRAMVVEYNSNATDGEELYLSSTATDNPLDFTTPAPADVMSLARAATSPSNATTLTYTLELDATITGLSTSNFSLSTTGITGASVASVSGSDSSYTVTVNTGTGDGTLRLNLANGTGILPGIVTASVPFSGETYTLDRTAPTLTPVSIASDNATTTQAIPGDEVTLSFTASEPIDTPTVTITGEAVVPVNTGGDDWTASYTMTEGDTVGTITFSIAFSDPTGNAGTTVTATSDASAVTFSVPEPPLPAIEGNFSNVDLIGPLEILPGTVINGGHLSGYISNQGVLTGTLFLGAGTTIDGGTVAGNVRGDPAGPALLVNVTVPAATRLEYVVIGFGTVLSPDAVIGIGVRFQSHALVPPGLDLTGALHPFRWSGSNALTVVDLAGNLLSFPSRDLLEALKLLPDRQGAGNSLEQDEGGALVLNMEGARGMLLPVRVTKAEPGTPAGTYADGNGNIVFVTAEGYSVLTYPVLLDQEWFSGELENQQLSFVYDDLARVQVSPPQPHALVYVARAAAAAEPAPTGLTPGVYTQVRSSPRDVISYSIIFEDSDGTLLEQQLVPVPSDWPELREALLALPGFETAVIDSAGDITVEINGVQARGRMSYEVFRENIPGAQPATSVGLQPVGDLNGDGAEDFKVFYPNGDVQMIYVYPSP